MHARACACLGHSCDNKYCGLCKTLLRELHLQLCHVNHTPYLNETYMCTRVYLLRDSIIVWHWQSWY